MTERPPLPQPLWDTLSLEAQAAVSALVQSFERRIADLEERVNKNSTNSSKPPSSDPPSVKRRPPTPASGKKRGGQPGHRHRPRPLVPPESLRQVIECKPPACRWCGHILGADRRKVVISDRFKSDCWIKRRPFCGAHLDRDFQAMIDRGGESAEVGRLLLGHSERLFDWWHRVRDGTMARATLRSQVNTMRFSFRTDLQRGVTCGCAKTAATCRELLAHETHLWTFVRVEGVEPTNNDAERALRHGVIDRKLSGGTDGEAGSRFVERMLSVVATCRQQEINVLDYLTRCYQAHRDGQPVPSLLPAASNAQAA